MFFIVFCRVMELYWHKVHVRMNLAYDIMAKSHVKLRTISTVREGLIHNGGVSGLLKTQSGKTMG
jgi:hypothetical protein